MSNPIARILSYFNLRAIDYRVRRIDNTVYIPWRILERVVESYTATNKLYNLDDNMPTVEYSFHRQNLHALLAREIVSRIHDYNQQMKQDTIDIINLLDDEMQVYRP